ncbi:MAG: site-specific integrase [Dehalococcoidia bacterium]|nr:site-specific integrase [Dehalococcoidia bacterium]
MRGTITKRGNDSYSIVFDLGRDPETGKRRQQWVSVKGTRKDAEKKLAELIHQLDTGTFLKPGKATLAEYLERWLKDYCWPILSPRTAESYQYLVRKHLTPALGQTLLTQLKPAHIQHLYAQKSSAGLSNRTVRYLHSTLHKSLKDAMKLGLINRNPAESVTPPRLIRHEMQIMSESAIQHLLEAAKETPYYELFYMALFTGLRRSELLALRWSDIDLLLCQVYVTRTLHQLHNREIVFRPTKTAKSRRMVSLSPSTCDLLGDYRVKREQIRLLSGATISEDDLVFCGIDGNPLLPNSLTHAWIRITRRCGLAGIRLHDARHTHASLMLKQGVHPKIVQERLGHSSIQVTLDTYSHVAPGLQQSAAAQFDAIVLARKDKQLVGAAESTC